MNGVLLFGIVCVLLRSGEDAVDAVDDVDDVDVALIPRIFVSIGSVAPVSLGSGGDFCQKFYEILL